MYELPTSVIVNNSEFIITNKGDFRMVLDCMKALRDDKISENHRVLASLLIFYDEFNSVEDLQNHQNHLSQLVHEMLKFINYGQNEEAQRGNSCILVDWEQDSQIICSAINKVAQTEIRTLDYLHWWTFLGYYMAIGESTFSTVVGIRNKILKSKKLEKWEREFRRDNPHYFNWRHDSVENREIDRQIRALWNNGE